MSRTPQARVEAAEGHTAADEAPEDGAAESSDTGESHGAGNAQDRKRNGRRTMALALLLAVAGSALVLFTVGRTWATAQAAGQFGGLSVKASGRDVNQLPSALALVGLASVVAVFATRRVGRVIVGTVTTLSGLGVAISAALGTTDTSALHRAAVRAAGISSVDITDVTHTLWPWPAAFGGLLLLLSGVLTLRYGRTWPGMSRRYEAPTGHGRPTPPGASAGAVASAPAEHPDDLWKALDRGEDPTDETPH